MKNITLPILLSVLCWLLLTTAHAAQTCTTSQIAGNNIDFDGISGVTDSNVVAVGEAGNIYRFDGTNWIQEASGTNKDLEDVFVLSSSSAYAVGKDGEILIYNSGVWSQSNSGTNEDLKGVWAYASNDVFAVGKNGIILHYNGTAWQNFSAAANTGSRDLEDAWGNSTYFYALAKDGTLFQYNRNTTTWTTITTCATAANDDVKDLWGDSSGNIYIAGKGGAVYKYDGSSCILVASPSEDVEGIFGSDVTGEIYAVGDNGVVMYYSGGNWIASTQGNEDLKDVWVSPSGNAFYASKKGYTSTCSLSVTPATPACTTTTIPSTVDLEGISGNSTSHVIAVGDNGEVYLFNGSTWSAVTVTSNPNEDLRDVYIIDATTAVAVGKNGTVLLQIAGTWSNLATPFNEDLKGVWAYSSSDIYVVGKKGLVYHYNGAAWTDLSSAAGTANQDDFEDAWGNNTYFYGLTEEGKLFRRTRSDNSWTTINSCNVGGDVKFDDVWGDGSGNLYLAGKDNNTGVVYRYDGSNCTLVASATEKLEGIYGSSSTGEIYATGKNGAVLYFNGTNWTQSNVGNEDLKDVWVSNTGQPFYAGKNGVISTCTQGFHHLLIQHDGSALTCEPESVTVSACANTDCSTLYTGDVNVTLSPTGWVGGDTQTISNGTGILQLRKTTAGIYTLDVSASSPAASNALVCNNAATNTNNCALTYYDSGFVYNVPDITACQSSTSFNIQAVRKDDVTQLCVPAFQNRTTNINLWTSYSNPNTGTKQIQLTHNATNTMLATSSPGTSVSLNFDANARAAVTLYYEDAGQVTLNSSFAGTGSEAGLIMTGSDAFISQPGAMYVYSGDASSDCASGDASCTVFRKTGQNFNLNVRAVCNNGPTYTTTPNFRVNNVALSTTNIAPAINNGSLGVTSINFDAAANGEVVINNQTLSEVGVFTITATPPALGYFGLTVNLGTSANIGRFTPDHFAISGVPALTNRTDIAGCLDTFTYMAEDFRLAYTLEARNSGNIVTQNYTGGFAILDPTAGFAAFNYGATFSNTDLSGRLNNDHTGSSVFTNGVASITNTMQISRTGTLDGPLNPLAIGIAANDGEGTLMSSFDLSLDGGVNTHAQIINNADIRYGRFNIENAFGPQTLNLSMTAQAQHFDGTNFVLNTNDNCTVMNSGLMGFDQWTEFLGIGDTQVFSLNNPAVLLGNSALILTAPNSLNTADDNNGSVRITTTVPGYLQYDWDGIAGDENPAGIATFGVYRGDDRIIFWREVNN